MQLDMQSFAERSQYRWGSLVLLSIFYLAIAAVQIGLPAWLAFVVGVASSIALTVITYHRLRDGAFSSAWLLLMILQFGIGPSWHLSENVTFNFGGSLISCVPVILGWIVPSKFNSKAEPEAA